MVTYLERTQNNKLFSDNEEEGEEMLREKREVIITGCNDDHYLLFILITKDSNRA